MDTSLISIKLRPMSEQTINLLIELVILAILGMAYYWFQRRRYLKHIEEEQEGSNETKNN